MTNDTNASTPTTQQLEAAVAHAASIDGQWNTAPSLQPTDGPTLGDDLQRQAATIHKTLPYDEQQAICPETSGASDDQPPSLKYYPRAFSEVMALRQRGDTPAFIAASAIPVDYRRRKLILHRRGEDVKTYPSTIHTVGGAFVPHRDQSLFDTLGRECLEEAGITMERQASASDMGVQSSTLLGTEHTTGSVQVVFLHLGFQRAVGAELPPMDHLEGQPIFLSFDELPGLLEESEWVPSGRLHILAWLRELARLDTFEKLHVHFAGQSPQALLEQLLQTPWSPPDNAIVLA